MYQVTKVYVYTLVVESFTILVTVFLVTFWEFRIIVVEGSMDSAQVIITCSSWYTKNVNEQGVEAKRHSIAHFNLLILFFNNVNSFFKTYS